MVTKFNNVDIFENNLSNFERIDNSCRTEGDT